MSFGANSAESCVNITITNDEVVEQTESFYVTLERTAGLNNRVSLSPTRKIVMMMVSLSYHIGVNIKDDETK